MSVSLKSEKQNEIPNIFLNLRHFQSLLPITIVLIYNNLTFFQLR